MRPPHNIRKGHHHIGEGKTGLGIPHTKGGKTFDLIHQSHIGRRQGQGQIQIQQGADVIPRNHIADAGFKKGLCLRHSLFFHAKPPRHGVAAAGQQNPLLPRRQNHLPQMHPPNGPTGCLGPALAIPRQDNGRFVIAIF